MKAAAEKAAAEKAAAVKAAAEKAAAVKAATEQVVALEHSVPWFEALGLHTKDAPELGCILAGGIVINRPLISCRRHTDFELYGMCLCPVANPDLIPLGF